MRSIKPRMSWIPTRLFRRSRKEPFHKLEQQQSAAPLHVIIPGSAAGIDAPLAMAASVSASSLGTYGFGDEADSGECGAAAVQAQAAPWRSRGAKPARTASTSTIFGFIDENDFTPVGFEPDSARCSLLLEALDETASSRRPSVILEPPAYTDGGYMSMEKGHCLAYYASCDAWSKADYEQWDA